MRVVFEDRGKATFGIGVEFDGRIKTLRKPSEHKATDVEPVFYGLPEMPCIIPYLYLGAAGGKALKTPCDLDLVLRCPFNVVLIHLRVDETDEFALVILENIANVVFV
jgi:hypothetical protein